MSTDSKKTPTEEYDDDDHATGLERKEQDAMRAGDDVSW